MSGYMEYTNYYQLHMILLKVSLFSAIIDLQDVLDALKKQSFTTSNWRQLCLRLGLSYNTLTSIESDHRKVERQLEEAISHWLRVKYDNKKYAMPSWQVLANGLERIQEKAAAEGIMKEKVLKQRKN